MKKHLWIFSMMLLWVPALIMAQPDMALDFTLPATDGSDYHLADHLGEGPILLTFWATWCGPCHIEMDILKPIYEQYADSGFSVVAISIDAAEAEGRVKTFIQSRQYPYIVLLDPLIEVMPIYQGPALPYTVLLDVNGEVAYAHFGYKKGDEDILVQHIELLLPKVNPSTN